MLNFSDRLKEERLRLNLNQDDFGRVAGVTKLTQFNYEKGVRAPDASYLLAIADAGVDVQYLLTGIRMRGSYNDLSPEEAELLNNYREMKSEDRAAILHLSGAVLKK